MHRLKYSISRKDKFTNLTCHCLFLCEVRGLWFIARLVVQVALFKQCTTITFLPHFELTKLCLQFNDIKLYTPRMT